MDTVYCEYANGRWELWTYSDGNRVFLGYHRDKGHVILWAALRGFHLQLVDERASQ